MNDNRGYLAIFDGMLAVILLFTVFLIFNLVVSIPNDSVSTSVQEFKDSQDVMEQLATKVNITDVSFLESVTAILKEGKNSKWSVREVSKMCGEKFKNLGLKSNYYFTETNHLKGDEIISNGDIDSASNITTVSRNYEDYCYVLYVW